MIRVILSGCGGRMGKEVARLCAEKEEFQVVAGVDVTNPACAFPVFTDWAEALPEADVIIDFSFHTAVTALLSYAEKKKMPAVIATTGFTEEEKALIAAASQKIPVFRSANMSIGINLLAELARKAARFLPDFDVEIVEKHHNQKVDAPSGTALMLADEIASVLPEPSEYIYERHSHMQKRSPNEIGLHSIRGGSIVGEHDVIFAGQGETITLSHQAANREILANGAICAARFLAEKPAGMYSMKDLLGE